MSNPTEKLAMKPYKYYNEYNTLTNTLYFSKMKFIGILLNKKSLMSFVLENGTPIQRQLNDTLYYVQVDYNGNPTNID